MALCNITGTVYLPSGAIAANRDLIFRRTVNKITPEYLGVVFPDDVFTTTDDAGAVDVDLITGSYSVVASGKPRSYVGTVNVPDAPSATFAEVLLLPSPGTDPSWYTDLVDGLASVDAARITGDAALAISAGVIKLNDVSGTDSITASLPPNIDLSGGYNGAAFLFRPAGVNVNPAPTLQIDGGNARTLYGVSGSDPIPAGELDPNKYYQFIVTGGSGAVMAGRPMAISEYRSILTGIQSAQDLAGQSAAYIPALEQMTDRLDVTRGQSADMAGLTAGNFSGSATMIVQGSHVVTGGIIKRFKVHSMSAATMDVTSWIDNGDGTYSRFAIESVPVAVGYNDIAVNVPIPANGMVGWNGQSITGTSAGVSQLPVYAATSVVSEMPAPIAVNNILFMVSFDVESIVPAGGGTVDPVPPALIDKTFTDDDGWTLQGATIAGGALQSGASSTWGNRCFPTGYPYSQLSKHTMQSFADIESSGQIWGISSIRQNDGHQLDTPAAIVDGVANMLRVYKFNSQVTTAPSVVASEIAIPWTLEGSSVRLDIKRVRFAYDVILTNLVSGEAVSLTLDYAAGTGADSGRPWGRPCILFPSTTAGGVRVSRVRYVADMPFPSGKAAKVVCIGDSITEGSQMGPDYDQTWSYLLEDERAALGAFDTVVSARGGQKSDGALGSAPEVARLMDADTTVIILIGTNDAGIASGSHAGWRANVQAMLDLFQTRTQNIVLCMLPPGPGSAATKRNLINADILGGYFPGLLPPVRFDLALSLDNDGVTTNTALYGDPTHPNVAGNQIMLERLRIDCPEAFE